MYSRTLTRAFVVCSILLFALVGRLTQGVRTAYDSGWTAPGCQSCHLPEGWVWVHTLGTVLLIGSILVALTLWWLRRRRELPAESRARTAVEHAPLLGWIACFGISALVAGLAAATFTYLADHEDHRGFITLANGLELFSLVLVAGAGLFLARTSRAEARRPTATEVVGRLRAFLQQQRITLIAVLFLLLVMTGVGQTSGQAVDSMRVWTEFGDDRSLARLSFGIASSLLLALVIYEGGMRLGDLELGDTRRSVRARWWLVAGGAVAAVWLILYFSLHRSLGWGLLVCSGILGALALLERGKAEGRPFRKPVVGPHLGAVEFLAVLPMLTLAVVAVSAAVDSGLAGAGGWEALRIFSPGALLAVFAVLMTSEARYTTSSAPRWVWVLGAVLFLLATGLLITFRVQDWRISSAVGFPLALLAAGYAVVVFRWRRSPRLGPMGGWQLSIPVALATGLATFFLLHLDPEGFGQTLGSFALVNLSLAFILAWLPWVIRWSLERRPPRVLWALGLQQLPIVSLVVLAWILAGVVKPPSTLHDVRLVDHPTDVARPTLTDVFEDWVSAQPELTAAAPGAPVPLVLVAAHGGGIKAAYWTALVLDCMVGVSPAGFDGGQAIPGDKRTCRSDRRDAAKQQQAARRIFLISSVSGGAMGMYAYARQLLAEGSLGTEPDDEPESWVNRRLARDFVSPTIGWALFHDVPNHILGLHPHERGVCAWHFVHPCATMDRSTVLEQSFDHAFDGQDGDPALRGTWEARASSENARAVPLLIGNATVTGGNARAVVSAADLGVWPSLEGSPPPGIDPRPLAGTAEVGDTLCLSNDLRLSTASLLAGHFPYVAPSGHLEARCGAGAGAVEARDRQSACAVEDEGVCELNLVDGGYAENSGLFTILALWPTLNRLVVKHNLSSTRQIALVIVEIDNHYRPRVRDVPRGSGSKSETLIPPTTAFGAHNAAETYARAAAQRVTGEGCTLTISPRLHPGLVAPLGWELSEGSRDDLRRGLVEPRPNAKPEQRLAPVYDLRRVQAWLGGEQVRGLDTSLRSCVP